MKASGISRFLLALGLSTGLAHAQSWMPIGPPPWTNTSIQTVGGITYFSHACWLPVCQGVISGPLSRDGTNLFQTISEANWMGPCPQCAGCYHPEDHVSVLGALAPGQYALNVSAPMFGGGDMLFATFRFTVPLSPDPTLTTWFDSSRPALRIAVAGVTNVTYIIEASSNLTSWTPVYTNNGAPFTWTPSKTALGFNQFFRTRLIGN